MPVNVDNIASLKSVGANTKKLRWVDSERSWFQSDPSATNPGDDVNIVAPNTGSGRWLKQFSVNSNNQGLIWQSVTAETTLSANSGYFVDLSASSGNVDLTLPSSPVAGQVISLIYMGATSLLKKAIVRRNGKLISSGAIDLQIYTQNQRLTLTYVSAAVGWFPESARPLEFFQASAIFTRPATTTVAQNGILNYLGTNLNTGSYLNPFVLSTNPLRPRRAIFCARLAWTNVGTAILMADKSTTATIANRADPAADSASFFILFYNSETKAPIQIKLSSLYIQFASTGGVYTPKTFNIRGAKNLGVNLALSDVEAKIASAQSLLPQQDSRILISPEWVSLATFTDANSGLSGNYYGNSGANATVSKFYDLNAADFYPAYMITSLPSVVNGTAFEGWEIRQMELYGEVIAA
ncbi:hypothetical protein C7B65_06545 [Phormidesmis priestleyi ULC007]|uniref:Uncharacterized protein n=1 Tax=Phormidesmis priestleyi ULC007 TaxID=1920490 RepID=A0A2T1DJ81_9CYAN|nr:hypothetical protein [Phormidesmis priestleyi]PSB20560.1 hypothetical protein C7B65_06545 [Phormidesmis priestleyi ULC007]PZO54230.1 MAG: hypothetical protein DCF14_02190 [Phormidesmis priestleyi]